MGFDGTGEGGGGMKMGVRCEERALGRLIMCRGSGEVEYLRAGNTRPVT